MLAAAEARVLTKATPEMAGTELKQTGELR